MSDNKIMAIWACVMIGLFAVAVILKATDWPPNTWDSCDRGSCHQSDLQNYPGQYVRNQPGMGP